jgi:hypothetical protein
MSINIDDVKCGFLIHRNVPEFNTRMYNRNVSYEELISWGDDAYNKVMNCQILFIAALKALKADFITDLTGVEHTYDIIVSLHAPLIQKFRQDQLTFYIESEPPGNAQELGRPWDCINCAIKEPYEYLINNYCMGSTNPRNIFSPFAYEIDYYQRINSSKVKNKIFLQKRSMKGNRSGGGFVLPEKYIAVNENSGYEPYASTYLPTYTDYCKELKSCEYMISNCWTDSPGQVTAESVLLDVIPFAPEHKLFTKLLLPKYCWFTTLDEVLEKIEELESNPELKAQIKNELNDNKKKLDYHLFRNQILTLFEDFVNNGKKLNKV